jgi:hypothetical protein
MTTNVFEPTKVEKNFYVDSVPAANRGKSFSIGDIYGPAKSAYVGDAVIHDANFAFLTTTLAKLHETLYEPKYFVTYAQDVPVNVGGGFVDYVSYFTVDWSGIMNEFRNVMGNNANFIPRVNAGLSQKKVNVYTFEVAYDLRFVELEKMKKLTLQKSIQDIYSNIIVAGWDLFVQKVAYEGINGGHGLFNNPNVLVTTIDNSSATVANKGFFGMDDAAIVSFFNGMFELCLEETGMNLPLLFDTILVPTFVGSDLSARYSALYTSTLRQFILTHNLAVDESSVDNFKLTIASRPALNTLGGHGRIVAYKKDSSFVRLDMPYPIQQYITLPNIERMSYTTAFVGQVSEIQCPYNDSTPGEFGPITYWDFVK